jgi:hypothetical protein
MKPREKLLAAGLGIAFVLWMSWGLIYGVVFGPIVERSERLADLTKTVEQKEDEALLIARARKQLTDWKARSLPPDRGAATSRRPDALDAQRLYQAWITDLAQLSGMSDVVVKPGSQRRLVKAGRGTQAANVYLTVPVTVVAEARFGQLATFLDHFQRVDLLHRLNKLKVTCRESEGDPLLSITLEAEGLALVDVPWRRTLFPETALAQPVGDEAGQITVAASEGFPKTTPFRVRVNNEYLTVTAVNGKTWTVARGAERTHAAKHVSGSTVELCPIKPDVPSLDKEAFREVLASNIFVQPPPPKEYQLKLGPLGEQFLTRGQKLNYAVPATGYDPTAGEPDFRLLSEAPPGLELDRGSGKLTWTPAADQPVGKFPLKIEVRHPNAPDGKVAGEVTVVFREPNTPPKLVPPGPQVAYRGQPWKLTLNVADQESPPEKLTVKLGDNPPEGFTLDAAKKELNWTPGTAIAPGDFTVNVTITDDGVPPQSVTVPVTVKVELDTAAFTFLTGVIVEDGVPRAMLYDRAQNKTTYLRRGDAVKVADFAGTVSEIGKDFVLLERGEELQRLRLGSNLRELQPDATAAKPAAAEPAKS